eukprot:TRINITY_DN33070_c0_g1_i1.p1 TRINITY_DN33070_c0_g1~~TRINITY_DN33070_c0_g1_i1.p1  ORF type:complete len:447 (+),score=67.87 TRINITY_DN33070_c0_g1_i1:239-1579(+)
MSGALGRGTVCRQIFDDFSPGFMSFLESHPVVTGVQLYDRPGVTPVQLEAWEAENHPYVLPEDFKAFLSVSDSVTVRWSVRLRGEVVPFGSVHVNRLDQVKSLGAAKIDAEAAAAATEAGAGMCCGSAVVGCGRSVIDVAGVADSASRSSASQVATAFDLDADCADGRVALLFAPPRSQHGGGAVADSESVGSGALGTIGAGRRPPEVWFQDLSCRWHFMARSFADYFRLLAVHFGVPRWHYAFTDVGVDAVARHWLALFCPERLAVAAKRSTGAQAQPVAGTASGTVGRSARGGSGRSSKNGDPASSPANTARRRKNVGETSSLNAGAGGSGSGTAAAAASRPRSGRATPAPAGSAPPVGTSNGSSACVGGRRTVPARFNQVSTHLSPPQRRTGGGTASHGSASSRQASVRSQERPSSTTRLGGGGGGGTAAGGLGRSSQRHFAR